MRPESIDLAGKTIVITGASTGIGAVAARELHELGANVLMTGRSPEKTRAVAESIGAEPLIADFAKLDDVRRLAADINERVERIDTLINNAGGTFKPGNRTPDGHEPNFQINHLSPFLLTALLHGKLAASPAPRVINTSSIANRVGKIVLDDLDWERRHATETRAYGSGKLMNILHARELARRWAPEGITGTAFHPGPVASEFGRDSFWVGVAYRTPLKRFWSITVEQGASPIVDLATRADRESINGVYLHRHKPSTRTAKQATDAELASALWQRSAELAGISPDI
ncbi:MAG: SDR family NAD(P)-dependent oxidoreductase [Actinobacteria bacterium]|nr:SDR family NAD(P)-dependent oxidoreductase [Actinomycetota bacterium]